MGFLSDLWGGFTGANARKDLDKGIGAVNANTGKATGALEQYGTEAKGYLSPYREGGGRAFDLGLDALGANGADRRGAAADLYASDPILAKLREREATKRGWAFNARGGYGSGVHALAENEALLSGYGDWQSRLAGYGRQGQEAAGATADIARGTGRDIAGAYGQNSAALAGLYGQRAQSQNALAQNLIGLGGVASRFMPWRWGNNLGGGDASGNP